MELVRDKNVSTYIVFPLVDADGDAVTGSANPDSEIDQWDDGNAPNGFADCTNEATELGATGIYYLLLSSSEMNHDYIYIQIKSDDAKTQHILINTRLKEAVDTIDSNVDAILVDTGTTLDGKIDTIDGIVDAILVDTGTTIPGTITTLQGNVTDILTDTGTTLDGKINTIDTNVDSVLTDTGTTLPSTLTTIEGKIDTADTVVDAIKAVTDNLPDSGALTTINTNLIQAAGLADKHCYIDTLVFDGDGNMTSCRKRMYDSAANATTHGAGGLLYTATITATYTSGNLASYLVTIA